MNIHGQRSMDLFREGYEQSPQLRTYIQTHGLQEDGEFLMREGRLSDLGYSTVILDLGTNQYTMATNVKRQGWSRKRLLGVCAAVLGTGIIVAVSSKVLSNVAQVNEDHAACGVDMEVWRLLGRLGDGMRTSAQSGHQIKTQEEASQLIGQMMGGYCPSNAVVFGRSRGNARLTRYQTVAALPENAEPSTVPMLWTADVRRGRVAPDEVRNCSGLLMVLFWDGSVKVVSQDQLNDYLRDFHKRGP